jgi:hypothetical protein
MSLNMWVEACHVTGSCYDDDDDDDDGNIVSQGPE